MMSTCGTMQPVAIARCKVKAQPKGWQGRLDECHPTEINAALVMAMADDDTHPVTLYTENCLSLRNLEYLKFISSSHSEPFHVSRTLSAVSL